MDRELKNKFLDILLDEYEKYLAVDDYESILRSLIQKRRRWVPGKDDENAGGIFVALCEIIPECVKSIPNNNLWYLTFNNLYLTDSIVTNLLELKNIKSIGKYAFQFCESLTNIIIPDSVINIGNYAFANCTSLTNITIPSSVISIGFCAFDACKSLKTITIPNSVKIIGNAAFSNCTSLTSITIPESVEEIGIDIFRGCSADLIIYTKNQYVIDYCIKNNIKYEEI